MVVSRPTIHFIGSIGTHYDVAAAPAEYSIIAAGPIDTAQGDQYHDQVARA
jgi:hypothetical protein